MKSQPLNQPELPYNGTSGHSGTDTSRERALRADRSGKTASCQALALNLLSQRATTGLTVSEFREIIGHHGSASSALSVLHKTGRIARLKERRNRCKIYIDISCAEGRIIEGQGSKKCCPHCGGNL